MADLGKGIQAGIVNITPEQAAKMLERNVRNRNISKRRVVFYAEEIKKGNWMLNGESIRFNDKNQLIDGQHRLSAIIKANVSVEMIVITGLNPEVFKNIDTGRNRNGGDALSIIITDKTGDHARKAGSLITRIIVSEKSNLLSIHTRSSLNLNSSITLASSNTEIVEYYRKNKYEIDEIVEFGLKYQTKTKKIMNLTGLMFAFWQLRKINVDAAEHFYTSIATGENLTNTNPIYHLREKLMSINSSDNKPPSWHIPAYIFKAWNAFRKGETMLRLIIRSNETEPVKPI